MAIFFSTGKSKAIDVTGFGENLKIDDEIASLKEQEETQRQLQESLKQTSPKPRTAWSEKRSEATPESTPSGQAFGVSLKKKPAPQATPATSPGPSVFAAQVQLRRASSVSQPASQPAQPLPQRMSLASADVVLPFQLRAVSPPTRDEGSLPLVKNISP